MSIRKITNLVQSKTQWNTIVFETGNLKGKVIQNLDFKQDDIDWKKLKVKGSTFLGCKFRKEDAIYLISNGAVVYPRFSKLPYVPHRTSLYTWQELLEPVSDKVGDTVDFKIYKHFMKNRYNPPMEEAMAERIHDYSIDVALRN